MITWGRYDIFPNTQMKAPEIQMLVEEPESKSKKI